MPICQQVEVVEKNKGYFFPSDVFYITSAPERYLLIDTSHEMHEWN